MCESKGCYDTFVCETARKKETNEQRRETTMINKNVETSGPWALICQLLNEHTSSSKISLCRSHRIRHCTYIHRFMCNTYLWIWGYWKVIHLRGCFSHQTRKGEASSPSISLSCHDPIMPVSIEHNSLSSRRSLECQTVFFYCQP